MNEYILPNKQVISAFTNLKAICSSMQVVKDVPVVINHKFTAAVTMSIARNLVAMKSVLEAYNMAVVLLPPQSENKAGEKDPGEALRDEPVKIQLEPIPISLLNIGQTQNNISPINLAELLFLLTE